MSFAPELLEALPDRYEPVRHIAEGGMGEVWCAHDGTLGRTVAIKLLARRFCSDQTAVRRFEREARAAARLSTHPHVVTIYDVGEAAGRPFIVMEHLPGGTVADALRLQAVSRPQALRWISEAGEALDFAHRHGVVHRDVKPANLLLDRLRSVRIADFGIAQLSADDPLTRTREVLGTAAYLAPEQALGGPGSAASDRYALAVVAFELLTGRRPFTAEHPAAQARAHIEDEPPRASAIDPSLPPALDAVLARGLDKRADRRWPTAGAFAAALTEALDEPVERPTAEHTLPLVAAGVPLAATAATNATAAARLPPRRSTRPVAALLAIFSVAAALLAILLGSGGQSSAGRLAGRDTHARSGRQHVASRTAAAPRPAAAAPAATTSAAGAPPTQQADPAALEAQGHSLLDAGNAAQAVQVLQRAVAAAPHDSLTYAYALFDLGRALLLDGQPAAAVSVLEQRSQIPNQSDVVHKELDLARKALEQARKALEHPGKGHGDGHGNGNGNGANSGNGNGD